MKKRIAFYGMLLTILLSFCFSASGKMIEKEISVKDFNFITMECNADLNIKIGDKNKLTVKADEKDVENLITIVENNNLELSYRKQGKEWWNIMGVFSGNKEIVFNVTVKNLNGITLTSNGNIKIDDTVKSEKFNIVSMGSGNIKISSMEADTFKGNVLGSGSVKIEELTVLNLVDLSSSGSGQFHLYNIKCPEVEFTASGSSTMNIRKIDSAYIKVVVLGSGTISLQGAVDKQNIKVDGTGRYYGGLLKSQISNVKALGASNVEVNTVKEISVDVFGSAMVNVDGAPKIKAKNVYGSGAMIMQTGTSLPADN